jgi:pimeloyl-ACP methyl ester carboxylesterase
MLAAQSHFVHVNGIRLHVLEWGVRTQRPVVLVHGGCAHAHWWTFIVPALAQAHRVLAVDLRGHGDSEWAEPPDYSIEMHAADIAGLLQAFDLSNVHLVGHSLGGLITIASAAAVAPRLRALVLIDTTGIINARSLRYLTQLSHWPHPVYRSQQEGLRRFRLLPSANGATPSVRDQMATHALRSTPDGTWTLKFDRRALALPGPVDLRAQLREIRVPTLVVRGALSPHVTPQAFADLRAALRHGSSAEIDGAYHHVMLDAPDELARVLVDFFAATSDERHQRPSSRSG